MGKKKSSTPSEDFLLLPTPPTTAPIVDTHTHIASTYTTYLSKYNKDGLNTRYPDVFAFARGMCEGQNVESVVDVWCEPGTWGIWREMADEAEKGDRWGGIGYWFVMGVHPHEAKHYTDEVEAQIVEAMSHPRCVGWGEFGLDYHYDNSPRDVQQEVFRRQLKLAIKLGKPLTIHTREAEEDCERILKEEVPKEWKIHIHCFTDSPSFAARLLAHFPNLYIGITGVVSYATNYNTANTIRGMLDLPFKEEGKASVAPPCCQPEEEGVQSEEAKAEMEVTCSDDVNNPHVQEAGEMNEEEDKKVRILLETDGPYMVPANMYDDIPGVKGKKLPLCHTAMIPWTAQFISNFLTEGGKAWDADRVMRVARDNARFVYGV